MTLTEESKLEGRIRDLLERIDILEDWVKEVRTCCTPPPEGWPKIRGKSPEYIKRHSRTLPAHPTLEQQAAIELD